MSNILDKEAIVNNINPIDIAMRWSNDSMRTIIIPTDDLKKLEDQWIEFNSMHKQLRRESDWKSIELFGMSNQDHYEKIKSKLLGSDFDNDIDGIIPAVSGDFSSMSESGVINIDYTNSYYSSNSLNYTSLDVEKANKWAKENSRVIIIPTRNLEELESLWDAFNSMINKHRRESDWMSSELFGVTNLKHYEYLKSQFLRQDIRSEDKEIYGMMESSVIGDSVTTFKKYFKEECNNITPVLIAKKLLEMRLSDNGVYENMITNNAISDILDIYDGTTSNNVDTNIPHGDLPLIDPNDMIDMGVFGSNPDLNFYGVIADNNMLTDTVSVAEWFEMYRATSDGFYTEFTNLSSNWVQKVRELTFGLKLMESSSADKDVINARKQSILELGWNPNIDFSDNARVMARNLFAESHIKNPSRFVDLRGFYSDRDKPLLESSDENKLKPVFIVFTEGKSILSKAIKTITKDIYSHISLSFDYTLKTMYSFGIKDSVNGSKGGFVEESINKIPKESRIRVYALFLKPNDYKIIEDNINRMKENVLKTAYSYKNLFTYLFNIPYNKDLNMMCSQFVDSCLKLCGIDISHKDSSLVSPHDMKEIMKKNRSIYTIYEGLAMNYEAEKTGRIINSLVDVAKPIKEMVRHYTKDDYIREAIISMGNIDRLNMLKTYAESVLDKNDLEYRILSDMVFAATEARAYCESSVKHFPDEFRDDGESLINSIKSIDYGKEYEKSSKALKDYFDEENIDGMKYELSKLWMVLTIIENKVHSKKFNSMNSEEIMNSSEYKYKAKITNCIKRYMNKLLKLQPEFNFNEYYSESPFSNAVRIKAASVEYIDKIMKKFVSPLQ